MKFEVIRNAPPPPPTNRGKLIYSFGQLKVGDAFDAPRDMGRYKDGTDGRQRSIAVAARMWAKRHDTNARFAVRVVDADTVRCWRIA